MHEASLVAEALELCRRQARGRRVSAVTLRCAAGSAGEVELAFAQLAGDVLPGAELRIEPVPTMLRCSCGFEGALEEASVYGHLAVCPTCAAVRELDTPLELGAVSFAAP